MGREAELESLEKMFAEVRLLTLTGSGGCGKTRLGLELAASGCQSRGIKGPASWISLRSRTRGRCRPRSRVRWAFVTMVGGPSIRSWTIWQDRDDVLVVDNCEHLVAAAAGTVEALLTECTKVTVIATSREPLGVVGETPWRVPRLSVPERGRRNPEELREFEAVRLFVDRAARANPSFTFSAQNAPDIAEVCARLDGIPLAIELAAARVRMLSPRQIREGLSDRFQLLTGGARTAVPRHQTLRASVDWSVDLLSEGERPCCIACRCSWAGSPSMRRREWPPAAPSGRASSSTSSLGWLTARWCRPTMIPPSCAISCSRRSASTPPSCCGSRASVEDAPQPTRRVLLGARRDRRTTPRRPRTCPLDRPARTRAGEPTSRDPLGSRSRRR